MQAKAQKTDFVVYMNSVAFNPIGSQRVSGFPVGLMEEIRERFLSSYSPLPEELGFVRRLFGEDRGGIVSWEEFVSALGTSMLISDGKVVETLLDSTLLEEMEKIHGGKSGIAYSDAMDLAMAFYRPPEQNIASFLNLLQQESPVSEQDFNLALETYRVMLKQVNVGSLTALSSRKQSISDPGVEVDIQDDIEVVGRESSRRKFASRSCILSRSRSVQTGFDESVSKLSTKKGRRKSRRASKSARSSKNASFEIPLIGGRSNEAFALDGDDSRVSESVLFMNDLLYEWDQTEQDYKKERQWLLSFIPAKDEEIRDLKAHIDFLTSENKRHRRELAEAKFLFEREQKEYKILESEVQELHKLDNVKSFEHLRQQNRELKERIKEFESMMAEHIRKKTSELGKYTRRESILVDRIKGLHSVNKNLKYQLAELRTEIKCLKKPTARLSNPTEVDGLDEKEMHEAARKIQRWWRKWIAIQVAEEEEFEHKIQLDFSRSSSHSKPEESPEAAMEHNSGNKWTLYFSVFAGISGVLLVLRCLFVGKSKSAL